MKDYNEILVRRSAEMSELFLTEPAKKTATKASKPKVKRRVKVNAKKPKKSADLDEKELEELRMSFANDGQPPANILGIPVKSS